MKTIQTFDGFDNILHVTDYNLAISRKTVFTLVRNQELCREVGEDGLCLRPSAGTSLSAAEHGNKPDRLEGLI